MKPIISKILYATDLSQNSSSLVFSYVVDMAKRHDAGIVILHAVEPLHTVSYAGASVAAMMKSAQKQEQEESLAEIKTRIEAFCTRMEEPLSFSCSGMITKILVPLGNPVEEILRAVDQEGCHLIVMGTHKKGFLENAFLGSVASSVLEKSRVPVLAVPLTSEMAYKKQDTI